MKLNKKKHLVLYDIESQESTINYYSEKGYGFFLLDSFRLKKNDFENFVIHDLRKTHNSHNVIACENTYGLIYCQTETTDNVLSLYDFIFLEKMLPINFFYFDIFFYNNSIYLSFTNQYKKPCLQRKRKVVALFIGDGIGDFFILNTLLHNFIISNNDYEYHIITYKTCSAINIIHQFYNEIKIYELNDRAYLEIYYKYLLRSSLYCKCYNIIINNTRFMKYINEKHIYDVYCQQLGYNSGIYYDDYEWIMSKIENCIPEKEKRYVDVLLSKNEGSNKIGFQFWTGPINQANSRCWDKQNVENFIRLCKNKYQLFNLTPYPNIYAIDIPDAQSLSIMGLLYLISKLDMIISIDSLTGHAAAMLGIPSITLWSSFQTPLCVFNEGTNVSIRVLRNNISIVPQHGIESINADILYDIIDNRYPQKNKTDPNWITYKDSKEGYDVVNIE